MKAPRRKSDRTIASAHSGDAAVHVKGTPFFFAGDEIGMTDVPIAPECVQDVFEKLVPGYGLNRDPERSPMRWDDSGNGGFTVGHPWLPMGDDVPQRNVLCLQQDPHSIIWLYRRLIELRRSEPALTVGAYEPMRSRNDVLMYKRSNADKQLLIALNFSPNPRRLAFDGQAHLLISTHLDRDPAPLSSAAILRGDEGIVLRLFT